MPDWNSARIDVLERLGAVKQRIAAHDESGALELINQQDSFCSLAAERASEAHDQHAGNCRFCEGFVQVGGCMGHLDRIDRAVLHGEWEEADRLVDDYAAWVRGLHLPA